MPNGPQTWTMLQALQTRIQNEVLVHSASPFTAFSASDVSTYGATNAIYIGRPKRYNNAYGRQCHIIPLDDHVYRRAGGGASLKVWEEDIVYIRILYFARDDWYQTMQDLIAAKDAMWTIIQQHAELPGTTVQAAKAVQSAKGAPTSFHIEQNEGQDWLCWGFLQWFKQEWTIAGGVIP